MREHGNHERFRKSLPEFSITLMSNIKKRKIYRMILLFYKHVNNLGKIIGN